MHHFNDEQIRALLEAAKGCRERDWLMILLARNHALRVSELIAITRDDVEFGEKSYLTIQGLKCGLRGTQALLEDEDSLFNERAGLFAFVQGMDGKQRLFPITRQRFWQIVRQHARTAKLPEFLSHPHTLRHTTAMQMLETAKLPEIQRRLRHKSLSSTGKYTEVDDARADAAFQKAVKG